MEDYICSYFSKKLGINFHTKSYVSALKHMLWFDTQRRMEKLTVNQDNVFVIYFKVKVGDKIRMGLDRHIELLSLKLEKKFEETREIGMDCLLKIGLISDIVGLIMSYIPRYFVQCLNDIPRSIKNDIRNTLKADYVIVIELRDKKCYRKDLPS